MTVRLSYVLVPPDEQDVLIAFVVADTYPFNGDPAPTRERVASLLDRGFYTETFWIVRDAATRVGIVQYQDMSPIHAEVHIRLRTPYRGQGIGTQAITWLRTTCSRPSPRSTASKAGRAPTIPRCVRSFAAVDT